MDGSLPAGRKELEYMGICIRIGVGTASGQSNALRHGKFGLAAVSIGRLEDAEPPLAGRSGPGYFAVFVPLPNFLGKEPCT